MLAASTLARLVLIQLLLLWSGVCVTVFWRLCQHAAIMVWLFVSPLGLVSGLMPFKGCAATLLPARGAEAVASRCLAVFWVLQRFRPVQKLVNVCPNASGAGGRRKCRMGGRGAVAFEGLDFVFRESARFFCWKLHWAACLPLAMISELRQRGRL